MGQQRQSDFNRWVHVFGISSGLLLVLLMVAVPVIVCTVFDIWPEFTAELRANMFSFTLMFIPFCFAESIAYPPVMGAGSVYMAYITGNTTSIKIPCALGALAIAQVEQGTKEANAVSLVAVGTSSLTVMAMVLLGLLLAVPLTPVLTHPAIQPAFNNVVPALMGGLLGSTAFRKEKYYLLPLLTALLLAHVFARPQWQYMLASIAVSLLVGLLLLDRKAAPAQTGERRTG